MQNLGGGGRHGHYAGHGGGEVLLHGTQRGIARRLNANVGKRMDLHFEQHKWIPSSCFGETEYFVTDFRVTE